MEPRNLERYRRIPSVNRGESGSRTREVDLPRRTSARTDRPCPPHLSVRSANDNRILRTPSSIGISVRQQFPSAILGQVFDRLGWTACVAGLAISLTLAAILAFLLKMSSPKGL